MPSRSRRLWWIALTAIAIFAWWRALATGFAQDDFRWLLRAAQGGPIFFGAPRVLSLTLWFRAAFAAFGTNPIAYHGLQLALHVGSGLLLFRVLNQRVSAGRAAAGAAFFLTSPALFDALHWASAITDLLCGFWLAIAAWLVIEHGRDRGNESLAWLGIVAYGLALLSKETAVGAAPALALLHWRCADGGARVRAGALVVLAIVVASRASGAWQTGIGEPYALALGAPLVNLPGYLAAAVVGGLAFTNPSDLLWARQAWVVTAGAMLLAVWITALVMRRSPGAWPGFVWFVGVLLPVLFLERQFHFFYLYAALPGLVMSVVLLVGEDGATSPAVRWATAALVALQIVLVEARAEAVLATAPLPVDFVLRRALIARHALDDLAPHRDRLRPRVVMLGQQPVEAASQGVRTTEPTAYNRDPWWDENVRAALSDGEAIRLMLPNVREVVFQPWLDPPDSNSTIAAYRIDGHLTVTDYRTFVGTSPVAATTAERLVRAGGLLERRLFVEARHELLLARAQSPDDADVLVNLGAVEAALGDSAHALETLTHAARTAPADLDVAFNLGLLQWRLGRRIEARRTWAPLIERAPTSDLARSVDDLIQGRAH